MAAITPSKIVAIHLKAIKIETIYVNKKKSPARLCVGDDVLNKDSLNSKAKRAKFLSHGQFLDLLLCVLSHVANCHGKSLRV